MVPALHGNMKSALRVVDVVRNGPHAPAPDGSIGLASGVWMQAASASVLTEKADYVRRDPDALYMSASAYVIPLLNGRFPDSPVATHGRRRSRRPTSTGSPPGFARGGPHAS